MPIIRLSPDTYLSTKDGVIVTKEQAEKIIATAVLGQKNLTVHQNVAVVYGRDKALIALNLKGINQNIPPTKGFLVKVYLSGSDGSLKRMYKSAIVDPADESVVRGSYEQYLNIEFDK